MFIYQTFAHTASSIRQLEPYHIYVKVPILFYTRTLEQCTADARGGHLSACDPVSKPLIKTAVKRDFAITAQGLLIKVQQKRALGLASHRKRKNIAVTSERRADMWSTIPSCQHCIDCVDSTSIIAASELPEDRRYHQSSVIIALRSFVVRDAQKEHGSAESCHCPASRMIREYVNRAVCHIACRSINIIFLSCVSSTKGSSVITIELPRPARACRSVPINQASQLRRYRSTIGFAVMRNTDNNSERCNNVATEDMSLELGAASDASNSRYHHLATRDFSVQGP